jgi:glutamate synthase (NADPH/NADH) small chain
VQADTEQYQTSIGKVFTAGDMRRGQSLVVWAIREGRQCARAVDEFLMGCSDLPR